MDLQEYRDIYADIQERNIFLCGPTSMKRTICWPRSKKDILCGHTNTKGTICGSTSKRGRDVNLQVRKDLYAGLHV